MILWRKLGKLIVVSHYSQTISVHSYSTFHILIDSLLCHVCREPRGFAFVQFVDPYDAAEAQHRMHGQIFAGREISVVVAAETRKRPEEMRHRARVR